jgi:hypothetical protein
MERQDKYVLLTRKDGVLLSIHSNNPLALADEGMNEYA